MPGLVAITPLFYDKNINDPIVDDGGGLITQTSSDQWEWRGTVGAGDSITFEFTTRVEDCLSASFNETRLNGSQPILVRNADGMEVGSGIPPGPFSVQKPVTLCHRKAPSFGILESMLDDICIPLFSLTSCQSFFESMSACVYANIYAGRVAPQGVT